LSSNAFCKACFFVKAGFGFSTAGLVSLTPSSSSSSDASHSSTSLPSLFSSAHFEDSKSSSSVI